MIQGIGTDIVEIRRIREACERYGDRFLEKIFSADEIRYAHKKANPYPSLAVRFAAKEAFAKAVRQGKIHPVIGWHDFSIKIDSRGMPDPLLSDTAKQLIGGAAVHVSLSHGQDYVVSFVVIERV